MGIWEEVTFQLGLDRWIGAGGVGLGAVVPPLNISRQGNNMCEVGGVKMTRKLLVTNGRSMLGGMQEAIGGKTKRQFGPSLRG